MNSKRWNGTDDESERIKGGYRKMKRLEKLISIILVTNRKH